MASKQLLVFLVSMYFSCGALWAAPDYLSKNPIIKKPQQHGFVSIGLIESSSAVGLDYARRNQKGTLIGSVHDEFNYVSGQTLPWLSAGYQFDNDISLGGEYLTTSGQSDGELRFRQSLGSLFPFLIVRPVTTAYNHKTGRIWMGYDALKCDNLIATTYAGLYLTHLHMKAASPGLGEVEDSLLGAMPLIGLQIKLGNPQDGQASLAMDYAYINVNQINAHATHATVAWERELAPSWVWGLGYTTHNFHLSVNRARYDASVRLGTNGFFSHVKWVF